MVLQNPTRFQAKTKVRKTVSSHTLDKEEQKKLSGPREAMALEVLHMMFLKQVAQESNFLAFQKKKNCVDISNLQKGAEIAMEKCFNDEEESLEDFSDSDSWYFVIWCCSLISDVHLTFNRSKKFYVSFDLFSVQSNVW